MEKSWGISDTPGALSGTPSWAHRLKTWWIGHTCTKTIGVKPNRSTIVSLLAISFLVQGLALGLFVSPMVAAATQPTIGSSSVLTNSDLSSLPRQLNKNSDSNPHFANTYYAKKTVDDAGTDTANHCYDSANTTCSLRSAINLANSDAHGTNPDLILVTAGATYNLVSTSLPILPSYITLSNSNLPSCSGSLTGDTQILGDALPANSDILTLSSNDVVSGIGVDNSRRDGFVLTGSNNVLTCSTVYGSAQNGVNIKAGATNNSIGSASNGGTIGNADFEALQNTGSGILISGTGATSNVVKNASIGYQPETNNVYPNGVGITIGGGASNNYIGSQTNSQQYVNLIRNNTTNGIDITGTGTNGNIVAGNYVGIDQTGLVTAGNGNDGILIENEANNNQIGGTGAGQANYIGGNSFSGIYINGNGTNNNKVQNNIIGVKSDFSGSLSNGTRQGTRTGKTVCTVGSGSGGTPDVQSEDCAGVFIATDGASAGPTGNSVSGNLIAQNLSSYYATGVLLDYASGNIIQGNSIDARIAGGTVSSLGGGNANNIGIWLINGSSNNQIGGDSSQGQGNLIGNVAFGVALNNLIFNNPGSPLGPMNNNKAQGNAVGVDFGGNPDPNLAISTAAIAVFNAANVAGNVNNNLIGVDFSVGSPDLKLGNLVGNTGNNGTGIALAPATNDSGNQVNGNYIGVKADGSAGSGNKYGLTVSSAANSRIQGNYIGASNLSAAITSYGMTINGATGSNIVGNYIGTNATGADLHNLIGVQFTSGANKNVFSQNTVGNNIVQGVQLTGSTTNQNTISQNSIFGNGGPGINLNYTYPNTNGIVGGSATGPNNQAAKPTITAATLAKTTLQISGTTNPGSTVEVFLTDGSSLAQGKTYLATVPASATSTGTFTNVSVPIASGVTYPINPKLVATSTLLTPASYTGSTSQFSDQFNNPTLIGFLSASPIALNYGASQGGSNPANQTVNLSATLTNLNFSSNISYGAAASGWLIVSPTSGTLNLGTPATINFAVTTGILLAGTYTATVTFVDTANPADTATVTVTFVVSPPTVYYLPLVANNAVTPVGQTTTFVTFQNLSMSASANISVQYYGLNNGTAGQTDSLTVPPKGQKAILPNIGSNNSGGGIITSDQPLNVVVSEGISTGGSAYNVTSLAASSLYSPLALNGAFGGFVTNIVIFNTGSTTSSGQVQFYDTTGNIAATQSFNIPAHASQTLSQANLSGLANSQSYWAKIVATNAGDRLIAQVIEFGPHNFVATFNASVATQTATKLYAPAAFNGLYGYVTGMGFANPNNTATVATVTYYDLNGNSVGSQSVPIAANGNGSLFQGAAGTSSSVASAVISSSQPLVMTVNERGPNTVSGTYVGIANGNTNVALPVMANGFAGFITGATIFNAGSGTATLTLTYLDNLGNPVGNAQSTSTLAPNASFALYQGANNQDLPLGYFGTALISSNQPLLVTTNALQTGTGLFYTYTEPSS